MNFEFAGPGRIVFGAGKRSELAGLAGEFGRRVLVVTGSNPSRVEFLLAALQRRECVVEIHRITSEPTLAVVDAAAAAARVFAPEVVIGIGGGSVVDAAKALSALVTNTGPLLDYLEVIGLGKPLTNLPIPYIAVPTTAGTGAEATRNAVFACETNQVKVSLRSPLMLPRIALVDPELALNVPPAVTASTGLDALTQLIEPFLCTRANPFTDAFCKEGIPLVMRSLRTAVKEGGNVPSRTDLALASLLSGICLANSGLGAVHGLAAPIGGMFKAPHGAVCAALLPAVLKANYAGRAESEAADGLESRFRSLAQILTGSPTASFPEAIAKIQDVVQDLEIPSLRRWGIRPEDFPEIARRAASASSMKANPVKLSVTALEQILAEAA